MTGGPAGALLRPAGLRDRVADLRHTVGALRRTLPAQLAETGQVWGLRTGFAVVRALPGPLAYRLFDEIADLTVRRGGKGVERLRANYARVRPELDDAELDALVREGMRSYLRYYCDAFRLPGLSREQVVASTRSTGDAPVREALAAGTGAVVFLGHLGNWDLGGAWSSLELAPVTTVAERLKPEAVFRDFLEFRESLGMTIIPLTGAGDPFVELKRAIARGDFVALLSDRDLTRGGLEVDLCGHRARVAKGPAVLTVMTGAPLFAAVVWNEPDPTRPNGYRVVVEFTPVPVPATGSTREKVQAMTQAATDVLGAGIVAHTQDWHMLQRVFADDLEDRAGSPRAEPA